MPAPAHGTPAVDHRRRAEPPRATSTVGRLLDLQRRAGNGAVATLVGLQRAPSDPTAPKTVRFGATGPAVEELQQHINRHGAAPPLVVDGVFGPLTSAGVKAFQGSNRDESGASLVADGVVGPLTWRALQAATASPKPATGPHPVDELRILFAKGDAMTDAEALRAKTLLFTLEGDEFRTVIKEASSSGAFLTMLLKLPLAELVDALASVTQEVVIPTTLLKPSPDVIDADFTRANAIYNPHGFEVERGTHIELSEKASRALIGGNLSLDEFTTDQATREERRLIEINRNRGRMAGYWVPDMTSSRGEALLKSDLKNMGDDRESIVVNAGSRAQDTFAHEVGHALGLPHDADPDNLMARGAIRRIAGSGIDKLTPAQLAIIRSSLFAELGRKGVGK